MPLVLPAASSAAASSTRGGCWLPDPHPHAVLGTPECDREPQHQLLEREASWKNVVQAAETGEGALSAVMEARRGEGVLLPGLWGAAPCRGAASLGIFSARACSISGNWERCRGREE